MRVEDEHAQWPSRCGKEVVPAAAYSDSEEGEAEPPPQSHCKQLLGRCHALLGLG